MQFRIAKTKNAPEKVYSVDSVDRARSYRRVARGSNAGAGN